MRTSKTGTSKTRTDKTRTSKTRTSKTRTGKTRASKTQQNTLEAFVSDHLTIKAGLLVSDHVVKQQRVVTKLLA